MAAMKWWGWGHEGLEFTHEDKPALGPFIARGDRRRRPQEGGRAAAVRSARDPRRRRCRTVCASALEQAVSSEVRLARTRSIASSTRAGSRCAISSGSATVSCRESPTSSSVPASEDEVAAILASGDPVRRGRDPVRRRVVDLGLARGAGGRDATGDLGRPRAPGPGARDRQRIAAGARAGRRVRSPPGGAAGGARVHVRPLSRLVHPLDARRVDRHAVLRDAVRPLRRHRRHDQGAARGHAVRDARDPAGAGDVDRTEHPRDGARQRGPARDHHRGDGPRPADPRAARDPRLSVPERSRPGWPRCRRSPPASTRCRSRGCQTRTRRSSRSRCGSCRRCIDKLQSRALQVFLRRRLGYDTRPDVPVVHRLRGQRASCRPRSAGRSASSSSVTADVHRLRVRARCTTRRSSTSPTSATILLDRGRRRRRVGDRDDVERADAALRRGDRGGERRVRTASASRGT